MSFNIKGTLGLFCFVSVGTKQTTRLEPSISAENVANANGINNNITTVPSPTASESSSSAGYSSNNPSINSEQSFNEEEPDDGWETEDDFYASDDEVLDGKEDGNVQEVCRLISKKGRGKFAV